MTTEVYTRSTCERCGAVDEREGAEASVPPVGWAAFELRYRAAGSGWTGDGRCVRMELCPLCAAVVGEPALHAVARAEPLTYNLEPTQ